jgi:hypothetical protein
MNIAPGQTTPSVNTKLVALLEKKLADAKAGKLVGAAVIGIYASGQMMVDTEGDAGPLHLGADKLRQQMLELLFGANRPVDSGNLQNPSSRRFSS